MRKKLSLSLFSLATLLLFVTITQKTSAASSFSDTSDVGVTFYDGPIDNGNNKPYKNNLALVWKPSQFDFGSHKAVQSIVTYNNTIGDEKNKQYLIVNDDRQDATTSGWSLSAKLSKLTSYDKDQSNLTAKLIYNLGTLQSYDIGTNIDETTEDYIPNNPNENPKCLSKLPANSGVALGVSGENAVLDAGGTSSTIIMKKDNPNQSKGGFATEINKVQLIVVNAQKDKAGGKTYHGTVTWTLDIK